MDHVDGQGAGEGDSLVGGNHVVCSVGTHVKVGFIVQARHYETS
jgi:hypothetical protein